MSSAPDLLAVWSQVAAVAWPGGLPSVTLQWGAPPAGCLAATYRKRLIIVSPKMRSLGGAGAERLLRDLLAHELLHVVTPFDLSEHGPSFWLSSRRVARRLGLPPPRWAELPSWPMGARPGGYQPLPESSWRPVQ
ncbi:MAG: hypothetical protein ACRDQ7_08020 [Haloechinothrix sp.]